MNAQNRHRRGFTLIELLVASTIVILSIGAATAGFMAQNKALQTMDMTRVANASTRDSFLLLESSLRRLGWGIDPRFAFDFYDQCIATPPGSCRDRVDGPDELAFVARNPLYRWRDNGEAGCGTVGGCFDGNAWPITAVNTGSGQVTIDPVPTTARFEKGQIVLASCPGGQNQVMLTLSMSYVGTGAALTLTPAPIAAPPTPYNQTGSLQTCHQAAGAALFLVDRFRFFVAPYGPSPWLMLDTGLDANGDGANDLVPVARNVEDIQVAYALQPSATFVAPDANQDWMIGNAVGSAEEPNVTLTAPSYTSANNDPNRFNLHPANVRAVRISMSMRSERTDSSRPLSWTGDLMNRFENRNVPPATLDRYRRYPAMTDVSLRNMESRSPFIF